MRMAKRLKICLKDIKLEFEPHPNFAGIDRAKFKDFSVIREKSKKHFYLPLKYGVYGPPFDYVEHFAGIELVKQYIKDTINGQS